jgi:hypothetical protein
VQLRFLTSVGTDRASYMEGQVLTVPDPVPGPFLAWLRHGIVEPVRGGEYEIALPPHAVEQAIARRARATKTRSKRAAKHPAVAPDEGAPVVPCLWPNSAVVCIAGGPSLTEADVAFCQGKARVIAINDAYRLAPWADVLYACDASWWHWHKGVPSFTGPKYALQAAAAHWPGVTVLRNTGEQGLEVDPSGLRTGRNSGYQAINLAVHLGATRILLLGYDMQLGPQGERHWFGDHPHRRDSPYDAFLERFASIVEPLGQLGVSVINCTRRTALMVFPQQALAEALC